MNDTREQAPQPERKVFGEYQTVELPVASYVRLPQVRSGMNPDLPDLKASIKTRGLINQIDVAHMSEAQLAVYIDFVNRTWQTSVSLDDYGMQRQFDDSYYVVVAGHSRTEAVLQLQEEDEAGFEYALFAKVHDVSTPEEIIGLQLDENIHSKPAQEQRAIAIVEAYRYGFENGLWANKADFLRQSKGKFSRRTLDEAMGFAELPPEARDFVFSGKLSYNAAVALGAATGTIMDYTAMKLGLDQAIADTSAADFELSYRHEVALLIAKLTNRKLNGPAAKKFIAGQVSSMQAVIVSGQAGGEDGVFDLEMVSAREQADAYRRQLERDYRMALMEMRERSVESVHDVLVLHRRLVGGEGSGDLEREARHRRRQLGGRALLDAIPSPRPAAEEQLFVA